mmetsp:Transcript_4920/g.14850  ORF Transcript_4920/g.14850 Transcript_4920/m.14850 type:complete len:204 (+) Transcript_4920:221-832(+)
MPFFSRAALSFSPRVSERVRASTCLTDLDLPPGPAFLRLPTTTFFCGFLSVPIFFLYSFAISLAFSRSDTSVFSASAVAFLRTFVSARSVRRRFRAFASATFLMVRELIDLRYSRAKMMEVLMDSVVSSKRCTTSGGLRENSSARLTASSRSSPVTGSASAERQTPIRSIRCSRSSASSGLKVAISKGRHGWRTDRPSRSTVT